MNRTLRQPPRFRPEVRRPDRSRSKPTLGHLRPFGLNAGTLRPGASADIAIVDPEEPFVFSKDRIVSTSKNTPFEDARFQGRVLQTLVAGATVFTAD